MLKNNKQIILYKKRYSFASLTKHLKKQYQLYLLILPAVILIIVFSYIPIYGVQIAFKDFVPLRGITGSGWVGLKHFRKFINSYNFERIFWNTLGLSLYQLFAGFPIPIFLALLLNKLHSQRYKKIVQTATYMPHFISVVVVVSMTILFTSPNRGLVGHFYRLFGVEPSNLMGEPEWFKTLFVFSGIWQNAGWESIIYLAALTNIDPNLYEAASIDGCSTFRKAFHIDIPGIAPIIFIQLLLNVGRVMSIDFEKAYLMQNSLNLPSSEVISTYVYKIGILNLEYSYSAAIGLFNSIINFILIITVNRLIRKYTEINLW